TSLPPRWISARMSSMGGASGSGFSAEAGAASPVAASEACSASSDAGVVAQPVVRPAASKRMRPMAWCFGTDSLLRQADALAQDGETVRLVGHARGDLGRAV